MATSTPGNEQVQFPSLQDEDWVWELSHTAILEPVVFGRSFSVIGQQPVIDIIVIYKEQTNDPYGFGFITNKDTYAAGGTFRRDEYTASMLKKALFKVANVLSARHIGYQSQSQIGDRERKSIKYIQFRAPSLLLEHQFSDYFNKIETCDYRVVALFDKTPIGFGFVQLASDNPKDPNATDYYNQFKPMVEEVKMIISGGLARSTGRFLGQGAVGGNSAQQQQTQRNGQGRGSASSEVAQISGSLGQGVIRSGMNLSGQQQRGETGSDFAASGHIFNTFGYGASNAPQLWSVSQPAPSCVFTAEVAGQSFSGHVGGHSYTGMEQPQSVLHYQPRAGMIPHTAINRPSASFWSGTPTGVTGRSFSGIIAGQQETNEWSGSRYGGGYSNTVMQQQPEPSTHYQTTAWPMFDAATSTTSSGSFGATSQLFGGSLASGQPTTGEWSRAVGANRPVQNRDARGHPSAEYPQWNMWK